MTGEGKPHWRNSCLGISTLPLERGKQRKHGFVVSSEKARTMDVPDTCKFRGSGTVVVVS